MKTKLAMQLKPGTPVRIAQIVERYPHFVVEPGATGVVVEASHAFLAVRMDALLPGAAEWDNEVHWYTEDMDAVATDLELRY